MTSSPVVVVPASASAAAVDSGFGSGVDSGVGIEPGMRAAVKMDRRHSADKWSVLQIP